LRAITESRVLQAGADGLIVLSDDDFVSIVETMDEVGQTGLCFLNGNGYHASLHNCFLSR
jgi:hypothetical protein